MGDVDRDVNLHVNLDTSGAEAGFRRVSGEAGKMGGALAGAAGTAAPSMQRLNQQLIEMGLRFQQTGLISTRALATVGVQITNLTNEYGKTAGAVDKLSKAERDFLTAAQSSYKEAIQRQKEFNEQMHLVQAQTGEWTGFQNAIKAVAGSYAGLVGNVFAVGVAFKAGWDVGQKFGKWMEENVPAWSRSWDELAAKITNAQTALTRLTDDPRFKGTRTEQLLPEIIARMARGKEAYEAAGKELTDYGETLLRAYYQNNLKLYEENKRKALAAQEDYIKRSNDLWSKMGGGFAGFVEQRGINTWTAGWAQSYDVMMQILKASEKATGEEFKLRGRYQADIDAKSIETWRKGLEDIGSDFANLLRRGLTDAVMQASQTGDWTQIGNTVGRGILDIVGKQGGLTDTLVDQLLGIKKGAQGAYTYKGQSYANRDQAIGAFTIENQDILAAAGGALQGWSAGTNMARNYYQQYQKLMPTIQRITQANVQGIMTMIASGNWIAGAVTAVIAAISSRIENARIKSQYPYGLPGVSPTGEAFFTGNIDPEHFANISEARQKAIIAEIQESFDKFYDGYYRILIKFPQVVLPQILKNITPFNPATGRIENFPKEATDQFYNELELWINGTMPREIAQRFFNSLSEGFTQYGMSAQKFKQIWNQLQALDPQKALELLNDLADGVINLSKAWAYLNAPSGWGIGLRQQLGSQREQAWAVHEQSFADKIGASDSRILRLAAVWDTLTGEDKIAATKELGQALVDRVAMVKEAFQQLDESLQRVNRSIQEQVSGYETANMSPAEQIAYWQAKINKGYQDLTHARNLSEAEQIESDIQSWIDRVVQAGGSTPQWTQWGIAQLGRLQNIYERKIDQFGDQIEQVNNDFIARFGPAYNTFLTGLDDTGTNLTTLSGDLDESTVHVKDFNSALDVARDNLLTFPYGTQQVTATPGAATAAPLRGTLNININGQDAGTVDVTQEGFTRRTYAARGRR